MSERMSNERTIELLKNDCCYECSWGCRNPIECNNKECDYRQAIITAIDSLDNEWVDVRDRLPSEDEEVLTTDKLYNISIARYCNKKFFDNYGKENHYVIAWKKVEPYERKE